MAIVKVRDLIPTAVSAKYGRFKNNAYTRYDEYKNLLANEVSIVDKTTGTPINFADEVFAKNALIDGCVGYDKLSKKFYYVYGEGIDEYGNPTELNLITANGKAIRRPASYDNNVDGAYILKAYPFGFSLSGLIEKATDFISECDTAIGQNLEACKTPYIVVCKNADLRKSFDTAIEKKSLGQAVIVVNEDIGDGLKAVNIATNYLVDKFVEARDHEENKLLNKLGILTANTAKKERVQSAEVNSTLNVSSDYIYLFIDTFNQQCDTYDLPFKMVFNGSMEELYEDDGDNMADVNDIEDKGGADVAERTKEDD